MNLNRQRSLLLLALFAAALAAPLLAPYAPGEQHRECVLLAPCVHCPVSQAAGGPGHAHWLGTDEFGRDELSRVLYATRTSVSLSMLMALASMAVAVPAALGSALSDAVDRFLRIAGEVARSLPWIFVLVAVRAALPLDAAPGTLALALIALFAAASWAIPAWAMRGAARALSRREFVEAARALGASRFYILRRHLWPNLRGLAATYLALLFVAAVLVEISLSLVGLGIPDLPSWGMLLNTLRNPSLAEHAWWLYAPLLLFIPTLTWLNLRAFARSAVPQQ